MDSEPHHTPERKISTFSDGSYVIVDGVRIPRILTAGIDDQDLIERLQQLDDFTNARNANDETDNANVPLRDRFSIQAIGRLQGLGDSASKLLIHASGLSSSIDQAMLLRDRVDYQRHRYIQDFGHVLESYKGAVASFSRLPKDMPVAQALPHLHSMEIQLQQDHERMKNGTEVLKELGNALSVMEVEIQEQERILRHTSRETVEALRRVGIEHYDQAEHAQDETTSQENQDLNATHPLLRSYYDKVGDEKVARGRLARLEVEYNDTIIDHGLREDQEQTVDVTRQELDMQHKKDRERLMDALGRTIEAAKTARAACVEAGLDPDGYKKALSEYYAESETKGSGLASPELSTKHMSSDDIGSTGRVRTAFPRLNVLAQEPPAFALIEPNDEAETSFSSDIQGSQEKVRDWIRDLYPPPQSRSRSSSLPAQRSSFSESLWTTCSSLLRRSSVGSRISPLPESQLSK